MLILRVVFLTVIMMKNNKIKILIGSLVGLLVVGVVSAISGYRILLKSNVKDIETKQFILVYPEDNQDEILKKIEETNCVKNMSTLKMVASVFNLQEKKKSGRYELKSGESNMEIVRKIIYGRQSPVRISFNAVRTKEILAEKITEKLQMSADDFLEALESPEILQKYGLTSETIISLFLPNTYEVYWNITPADLIERMKKEYDKFWTDDRKARLADCNLTQTEVSTLASIVEEETLKKDEKPMVAGLYLNRLRIGMALQADPTVKFALQDFSLKRIYGGHLQCDSPYNTYKYAGLPPGPIRTPSADGIDAVLNYTHHNYIYMCAKEDFSGYHNFASTYAAHQENAQKYRRALNRLNIR